MSPRTRAVLYWAWIAFCIVCGAVLLGLCAPVKGETVTFTKARTCGTVTVGKRGLDVIIRCDGAVYLTIVNQPLTCPQFRYTSDAKGNPTIFC